MYCIYAVCGYAGHGKDTLVKDLQQRRLSIQEHNEPLAKWKIWSLPDDNMGPIHVLFDDCATDIKRYAFADELKRVTHKLIGLKNCPIDAFENVKDSATFVDPLNQEHRHTIRDWYIRVGNGYREYNPLHWTWKLHAIMDKDYNEHFDIPFNFTPIIPFITDWRFGNELINPDQTITIRLHRALAPIKPKTEHLETDSEHNLDNVLTRYLFFDGEDPTVFFPQYKDYVARCAC